MSKKEVFRGHVYICDFGIKQGNLQNGKRPIVVIGNNIGLENSPVVTVIPVTSEIKATYLPTHYIIKNYKLSGLDKPSMVLTEQMTTINKSQIVRFIGKIEYRDICMKLIGV